ncbi:homoserine kinase [Glutamicibacter sp. MNS18]|uniref:homoserine kinase n=1 Tax=Glutamicibacter sp. MNS18 TaxID=2989817 RepID=UPI00223556C3|nr:homoserine kinase [Glutamicibacter sp. MNS18]MCW4466614.1 homoserine kinase [Glutamicibacter sp. MNS18]
MTASIALGQHLRVAPPATSANLGPGFDAFGLALEFRDELRIRTAATSHVVITGEGAGSLPRDESHLIIAKIHEYWQARGFSPAGIELEAINRIPHARGLGSSAAAIVAAYAAADALLPEHAQGGTAAVFQAAAAWEGHPDNVAPAVYGGFSVSLTEADGSFRAIPVAVHESIRAVVAVPATGLSTEVARGVLPAQVSHADAAANSARAALLIQALGHAPDQLLAGTEDFLHQSYRAQSMPESSKLMETLRQDGLAAVISGAGPTVLVLVSDTAQQARATALIEAFNRDSPVAWRCEIPAIATSGVTVEVL